MTPQAGSYPKLDQEEILAVLFHPRRDPGLPVPAGAVDLRIPIDEGVGIGSRFHLYGPEAPNILFFHGNGEIVSDYDEIGGQYTAAGLNFLAVDYRGYGKSSGTPTVTAMLNDAHLVLDEISQWLTAAGHTGPLIVMGRSLGSAPALELAANRTDEIAGLIIESGFATTLPLLVTLGVNPGELGITEADGFNNAVKITRFTRPTLILHAANDQLIPLNQAGILQSQCTARSKEFQIIPGADHNTIFQKAGPQYFEVIRRFTDKITGNRPRRRRR